MIVKNPKLEIRNFELVLLDSTRMSPPTEVTRRCPNLKGVYILETVLRSATPHFGCISTLPPIETLIPQTTVGVPRPEGPKILQPSPLGNQRAGFHRPQWPRPEGLQSGCYVCFPHAIAPLWGAQIGCVPIPRALATMWQLPGLKNFAPLARPGGSVEIRPRAAPPSPGSFD